MKKKAATLWTALFFTVLTLLGLINSADYGQPLDGPSEQVILQENLKEYAILLLGEDSAAARGYDALDIQRISESIEMDHGQAAYYPAAVLLPVKEANPHTFNTLWHMYTWLWFMVGVLAVYFISRGLGLSAVLACATALLLFLSPRFFAEGHYNNKDIVLLSLTLWTAAAGLRFLRRPTVPGALFFGLAGALAANTRIIGFFVFGVMGIMTIVSLAARRELHKPAVWRGGAVILSFLAFYVLLTPAILAGPGEFISHLIRNATGFTRWTGVVVFKGAIYNPTRGLPLPHSYLPTMMALTIPVAVLALVAIGGVYAVYRCAAGDTRWPALASMLVIFALPFLYAVLAQPLMYNGWRHFYFLYGPLVVLAGLGLSLLQSLLQNSRIGKAAGAAALALVLCYQGIGIVANHPYQYAYYNELAQEVQDTYELDYWEVSTLNALDILGGYEARNKTLLLAIGSGDPMSLLSLQQCMQILPGTLQGTLTITEEDKPPYVFSNSTYARIYGQALGADYVPLFTIESYGNTICTMYERIE